MAKRIVTLYIDDSSLRLLVTQGQRMRKWADLPLEPGLIKNNVIVNEKETGAKIRQLFNMARVNDKKIVVGLSGLRCLTRVISLPQLPNEVLDEAVRREAKATLPVSPEQLYLSWQPVPAPPGKTRVFLAAIPRIAVDALFRVMRQLGLKPYFMDLKPLALNRVAQGANSIIIDVQPTELEIIISVDGVPQPIRTESFPVEPLSWGEKAQIIRNALDRSIEFFNSNNPEKPIPSDTPIFASGDLSNGPESCQSLSEELGRPVMPVPVPFEYLPTGITSNRYIVNMGLALKQTSPSKGTGLFTVNLNVIPADYMPESISVVRILVPTATVIVLGVLFFLVLLLQEASADNDILRSQLISTEQLLQKQTAENQAITAKTSELKAKISEAESTGGSLTTALDTIERQSQAIDRIGIIISKLTPDISLIDANFAENTYTLNGISSGEKEVLSFLEELDTSGQFSEVIAVRMNNLEGGGVAFTAFLSTEE